MGRAVIQMIQVRHASNKVSIMRMSGGGGGGRGVHAEGVGRGACSRHKGTRLGGKEGMGICIIWTELKKGGWRRLGKVDQTC